MLHAVVQNKTAYYKQYFQQKDESTKYARLEDELTSSFIGPHAFMSTNAVFLFWNAFLGNSLIPDPLILDEKPIMHELRLWPSRIVSGTRIEPDAQLIFQYANGEKSILLIEFKWRSGLSGADQLERQWLEYLNESDRQNAYHVFIGLDTSRAIEAVKSSANNFWDKRFFAKNWGDVRDIASNFSGLNEP